MKPPPWKKTSSGPPAATRPTAGRGGPGRPADGEVADRADRLVARRSCAGVPTDRPAALGDRQRLGAGLADQPLQPQHQLDVGGQRSARRPTTGRPASTRCTRLGQRHRAGGRPRRLRARSSRVTPATYRRSGNDVTHRSPRGATLADMTLDSLPPTPSPATARGSPRSPSTSSRRTCPTDEALAAVEKFDDRFLDRELSWLRFNQRVLELAEDRTLPLLERARFLAIFTSNLDEFFMVRVAGLKRRIAAGLAVRAASGLMPREVLEPIWSTTRELSERQARLFRDEIVPALAEAGIELVRWDDLDREEQKHCKRLFKDRVFPVLTPLAVDPAHPFPYISGLSLNLAVLDPQPEDRQGALRPGQGAADLRPLRAARQPALRAARGRHRRAPQAALPGHGGARGPHLPGHPQRGPRGRGGRRREPPRRAREGAAAPPVRPAGPARGRGVDRAAGARRCWSPSSASREEEVFRLPGPLDLRGLHGIADLHREELKYPAFVPDHPPAAGRGRVGGARSTCSRRPGATTCSCTTRTTRSPPRCSGSSSRPPPTRTCSRSSRRSTAPPATRPIIDALIDAAEAGKQVLVIVEIKARFDEEANIRWARKLEQAGCHVVYGLVGLKTHCKLAMVVRDEPDGIRRYTHIGTGNYNPKTVADVRGPRPAHHRRARSARTSPTCSTTCPAGRATRRTTQLLVAPDSVRSGLVEQIHREIAHHQAGRPARIRIKANSVVDEAVIDALYLASQAGRAGRSCWSAASARCGPAYPACRRRSRCARSSAGSSSTAGSSGSRTAASRQAWIGSADMMHRNLDRRVEVLVRLPGDEQRRRGRRAARPRLRRGHRRLGARQRRRTGPATAARCTSRRP